VVTGLVEFPLRLENCGAAKAEEAKMAAAMTELKSILKD
jgi:hypothetical protein